MENTIVLNPLHVIEALNVILTTQDEQIRARASEYLRLIEQNQQEFPLLLIQIYQQENQVMNKLQSLLLLKNVIVRNWIKAQIIKGKRVNNFTEDTKSKIKQIIIVLLKQCQEQREKNIINQILQAIAKYDFPGKFIELENYFYQQLQVFSELQNYSCQSLKDIFDYLTTLKQVQQELVKNKLMAFKVQQKGFSLKFLPIYIILWKNLTLYQQQQPNDKNMIKIQQKLDRVLGYLIMTFNSEENQLIIQEVFRLLLEKTAYFIKLSTEAHFQVQIKTLTQILTTLSKLFPVSIAQFLNDYTSLILLMINQNWNDFRLKNIAIISLTKLLQTHQYYCPPEQFKSTISQISQTQFVQQRESCHQFFNQYFNQHLQYLIERLIILNEQNHAQFQNCEVELDQEETQCQKKDDQDEKNDIHKPTQQLCIECFDQIIQRFPQKSLQYIKQNIKLLQEIKLNIKLQTLDSFLQFVERFCKLQQKEKDQLISIIDLFDYIIQFDQLTIQFRFVQIGQIYLKIFNENQIVNFFNKIKQLTMSNHQKIQIVSMPCLKDILEVMRNQKFQIINILLQLIPVINSLISNEHFIQYEQIIFELLGSILFMFVLEKNQDISFKQQILLKLEDLFNQKPEIVHLSFCQMFQKLVIQFPYQNVPDVFFEIAISYFKLNLKRNQQEITNAFLLILQEYNLDFNIQLIGNSLQEIFIQNQITLLSQTQSHFGIKIFEELLLMGLINQTQILFNEVLSLIVKNVIQQQDISDKLDFLLQCLSLLETMILSEKVQIDDQIMNLFLNTIIKIFIQLNLFQDKSFKCIDIINKLINFINFFQLKIEVCVILLLKANFNLDEYFIIWQNLSINIKSKGDQRRNILSTLKILKYISNPQLNKFLNSILKETLLQMSFETDMQNNQFILQQQQNQLKFFSHEKIRMDYERRSYRKEKLLDEFLYKPDKNIQQILIFEINEIVQRYKLFNNKEFQIDEKVLNQLNTLLYEC